MAPAAPISTGTGTIRFFFEKQFVDHPALLKIGRDLAQCPIVFNVLLYDKSVQERPRKVAAAAR
jgi:hypothetical protein